MAAGERNRIVKAENFASQRPAYIMRTLAREKKIDSLTATIVSELKRLRDAAAHGAEEISSAEAVEFCELALRLAGKLAKI
jgi:hypothetical protein